MGGVVNKPLKEKFNELILLNHLKNLNNYNKSTKQILVQSKKVKKSAENSLLIEVPLPDKGNNSRLNTYNSIPSMSIRSYDSSEKEKDEPEKKYVVKYNNNTSYQFYIEDYELLHQQSLNKFDLTQRYNSDNHIQINRSNSIIPLTHSYSARSPSFNNLKWKNRSSMNLNI